MAVFPLTKIPKWGYHKGSGKRWFGATRDGGRTHAACDLIASPGKPVLAVDTGTYLYRESFYLGTDALVVQHNGFLVRYGEVSKDKKVKGLKRGDTVHPGQVIGYVGGLKMLHFEMYKGTEIGPLTQRKNKTFYNVPGANYQRRADLMDPTPYLNQLKLWTKFTDWVEDVVDDIF
ncbi:MAG: M23 family metallopeptidase [Pyrinomonadaceae bacterium]